MHLTKNSRGKHIMQTPAARKKLLAELGIGVGSLRSEGCLSLEEAFTGLKN